MIHRFRVKNFKSIVDVDVDLSPVTVIVGRSGTGKTNFVQAIRCLRDVLISSINADQWWGFARPVPDSGAPTEFAVDFSVAGLEETFRYELSIASNGSPAEPDKEALFFGKKCLFHQERTGTDRSSHWVVEPELLKVPNAGGLALGRIASISEIVVSYTVLTSGIGYYAFSDRVLCEKKIADQRAVGLIDDATNYLEVLKAIVSNLQELNIRRGIVASLQRVNPSVSSVELNDLQNPQAIVVGHRFDGKTLELGLHQESDGFRRFYAHLLAIYQRPPKQTLIFEHPEDGIHPGALALLADEFKAAPTEGNGQVILTTHSPELLDHFDVESIRVVELDGLMTRIGTVAADQLDAVRQKLLEPGELLTVDLARIQAKVAAE